MSGLVYESIQDLPHRMRQQVAAKILESQQEKLVAGQKRGKYGNVKAEAGGVTFDSQKECRRFILLMLAVRAGVICDLRLQQNFTLVEGFTKPDGERIRPVVYKADFTYRVADPEGPGARAVPVAELEYWKQIGKGAMVVEDVKSKATRTRVYINKMKMMADKGYEIREV